MYKKESLPKVGEYYHFFDDGKITPTRHYIAKCLEIIPFDLTSTTGISASSRIDL